MAIALTATICHLPETVAEFVVKTNKYFAMYKGIITKKECHHLCQVNLQLLFKPSIMPASSNRINGKVKENSTDVNNSIIKEMFDPSV